MAFVEDTVNAFLDYEDVEVGHSAGGPLAGLTVAVKDLFDVAGYPTGCGHPLKLKDSGIKKTTAPSIGKLFTAGARFVGKTHLDELAFSLNGQNMHYGTPVNVAAPGRIPGGSSSGSAAAVAAGLCDFAIGTDTGGSVRAPASYCGLIGLRPSHGRISLEGAMAVAPSFDTLGWFARDVDVFARVGAVLLGDDPHPVTQPLLLMSEDAAGLLETPELKRGFGAGLGQVTAALGPVEPVTVAEEGLDTWYWTFRIIQGYEALKAHGKWLSKRLPTLAPPIADRFEFAKKIRDVQAEGAGTKRAEIRGRVAALLGDDGVLVLPTMPGIAPLLTTPAPELDGFRTKALKELSIAGLTGFPQITLPLATVEGCPFGISLIGPAGSDRSLIEIAARILKA